MKSKIFLSIVLCFSGFCLMNVSGQDYKSDSAWKHSRKNIVRYNISSALLYGFDKGVILGYERVLKPNQSISFNIGTVALPKLTSIGSDSITFNKDVKNSGFNASLDYRFYLGKINKYNAPRGVYIGPWYSYNRFTRDNTWNLIRSSGSPKNITANTDFNVHSFGVDLGYQFIFWDRLAVDLVMIGPGMGLYNVNAKFDTNLTTEEREQLQQLLTDALENKFPGMNFVFNDKTLDANGALNVTSLGYRYIIHIGFRF
jgi:hypothetical protein